MTYKIHLYTDGSHHHQTRQGAWAALIHHADNSIILKGIVENTTNNRMELWAVIQAITHIKSQNIPYEHICIHTDSQYVIGIDRRKDRLQANNFYTKTGKLLPNVDLLKMMINYIETEPLEFIKVKAHLKKAEANPYHRKVDKLVRRLLRHGD
jgi:ribonuclease HI